jgi:hypothetical protein
MMRLDSHSTGHVHGDGGTLKKVRKFPLEFGEAFLMLS